MISALRFFIRCTILFSALSPLHAEVALSPQNGWKSLSHEWDSRHPLNALSIEWQYFMIHDRSGQFNGIIGYVLTNPRNQGGIVGSLAIPKGGNLAIGGQVKGRKAIGEYINFGIAGTQAQGLSLETSLSDPKTGYWAKLNPLEVGRAAALHLSGETEQFAWDLEIWEAAPEIMQSLLEGGPFSPVSDAAKVGHIRGESWTVDAVWPRTEVTGTLLIKATGEWLNIDGKGYRENSYGRYAMPLDGWDFFVFSEYDPDGVVAVLQTYHQSETLDYLDLAFRDEENTLHRRRFTALQEQLQWRHLSWLFDKKAQQCVPQDWDIIAEDTEYLVTIKADISPEAQAPFISNKTLGTRLFFIQEQYPWVTGQIYRKADGKLIKSFQGQAGGEFALHKRLFGPRDAKSCQKWGKRFSKGF